MINSVYNYYLSTYSTKELTRSDVHKKSELRSIYNNIIKLSKKTPLYKINLSEDTQKYIIGLKENAIALKGILNQFDFNYDEEYPIIKTKAISSNEDLATVKYIGENIDDTESMELSVQKLASPQINNGKYLEQAKPAIQPGSYVFEIGVGNYFYEFHTSVKESDSNLLLQERIARLVNKAKIGLIAEVKFASNNNSALELQSISTGVTEFKSKIFDVVEEITATNEFGIVDYLGIDHLKEEASNAKVTINNIERSVASNVFNISGKYEVTLNNASQNDETTSITLEEDYDSVIDNVSTLVQNYNNFIYIAKNNSDYVNKSTYIYKDISNLSRSHKNTLDSIGITVNDDATLDIEESLLVQSIKEGSLSETLGEMLPFKNDLVKSLNHLIIDPMRYVNKTMILYPHPIKPATNPYMTSRYTGMMFNGYV